MTDVSSDAHLDPDPDEVNFFADRAVQDAPYAYFDRVRERGPVWQEPHHGVYMVTGHPEAMKVYGDPANFPVDEAATGTFSSCNAVAGNFFSFSQPLEGDDVTDVIRACRHELPFSDQLPAFDPPDHTAHRHLLGRLITPKRLKENEQFMWEYADHLIDRFHADGRLEVVGQYAEPFTLTVIADLEGVPDEDHEMFRDHLSTAHQNLEHKPLEFLYDTFANYIEERRAEPRNDILSSLASGTFPDGSEPTVQDAALLAANLFAGGQETTVRLLTFALRMLGERPDLQGRLRENRDLIPTFLEETLRLESPLRTQFRMARVTTELGGVHIPAGSTLMLAPGACNRDPRVFDDPHTLDLERVNARQHLGFGHGIHTCIGAPLARAEGKASINRMLDRMRNIRVDEDVHGPADARRFDYIPTFFLRGIQRLTVTFDPIG
jgi:cytochrome P450